MKVTITFMDPEKLKRLNAIQAAKYEFERSEKNIPEKIFQSEN
jgi:hypothetical protein